MPVSVFAVSVSVHERHAESAVQRHAQSHAVHWVAVAVHAAVEGHAVAKHAAV